ncbi:MAG: hypothetical protein J0G32_03305 [Alphaproteobacteria bacterium]|nr:hypothetical protein [Alphaproteobacteria bacterium]OJV12266.1 MAG: hypothetical protein BGO27_05985 [Alphaproteobacteria bacterium 33-17]
MAARAGWSLEYTTNYFSHNKLMLDEFARSHYEKFAGIENRDFIYKDLKDALSFDKFRAFVDAKIAEQSEIRSARCNFEKAKLTTRANCAKN